ncbi:MAG TPA: hypothetical protein VNN62_16010 [Methylomirabilota bacterium]|jgi:hypothetical protein|nr:hypothetical protein [Methylomirabilota bacterium]
MVTVRRGRSRALHHTTLLLCQCVMLTLFGSGCATVHYETRPFFLEEQDRQSHGRKT